MFPTWPEDEKEEVVAAAQPLSLDQSSHSGGHREASISILAEPCHEDVAIVDQIQIDTRDSNDESAVNSASIEEWAPLQTEIPCSEFSLCRCKTLRINSWCRCDDWSNDERIMARYKQGKTTA